MTSIFTTGGIRGHGHKRISKFYPRTHNMGITRATYNIVGGFGNLRHGQDIEYSNRIRKSGAKISFIEKALVYHRRRSTFRQFFKQVFNWGIARINLGKIDPDMLELIHFLPSLALVFSLLTFLILIILNFSIILIISIFFFPLFLLSIFGSFSKKNIKIMPLLLLIIPIQVLGYGLGFIIGFVRRFIFNRNPTMGFKKNYYK